MVPSRGQTGGAGYQMCNEENCSLLAITITHLPPRGWNLLFICLNNELCQSDYCQRKIVRLTQKMTTPWHRGQHIRQEMFIVICNSYIWLPDSVLEMLSHPMRRLMCLCVSEETYVGVTFMNLSNKWWIVVLQNDKNAVGSVGSH